jgi:fructokinase
VIVVCGEALVDLVPVPGGTAYAPRPGGSPANVAVALGRVDVQVSLLAQLSTDAFGRLLREHLTSSRVDLSGAVAVAEPSTLAVVTLDASGKAEYSFYVDGCADSRWRFDALPATLPVGAALHVSGSLAMAVPAMGDTVEALLHREHGQRVIAFDPNPRPALVKDAASAHARLDRWVRLADIVKVSADDLAWVAPGLVLEDVARSWLAKGCTIAVVTRGGDGVYALGPAGPVSLPANPVELVDTVGAGDAFMAGLLAALDRAGRLSRDRLAGLTTAELTDGLRYAQRLAAVTCTRRGADPPWSHEL